METSPPSYNSFKECSQRSMREVVLLPERSLLIRERFLTSPSRPARLTSHVDPTTSRSPSSSSSTHHRDPYRTERQASAPRLSSRSLSPSPFPPSTRQSFTSPSHTNSKSLLPKKQWMVATSPVSTRAARMTATEPAQRLHSYTDLCMGGNQAPASAKQTPVINSVELFVYDLSKGLVEQHSETLMGVNICGIYHSSVVCYGMEFFFEGGISSGRAGCSRFGQKYLRVPLGQTKVPLHDFLTWTRWVERTSFQVHDYHLADRNCHHFSQKAVQFLLGEDASIPSFLHSTSRAAFDTAVGKMVAELLITFTRGIQWMMVRKALAALEESHQGRTRLFKASLRCRITTLPEPSAVCFRVLDKAVCRASFLQIQPFLDRFCQNKILDPAVLTIAEELANEVTSAGSTWCPKIMQLYVDTVVVCLLHSPLLYWGPLLNTLRILILNRAGAAICLHHSHMISLLSLAVQDFPRLALDGKLSLLRLLCNFSASPQGCVLLDLYKLLPRWNSLVGLGLMDRNEAVRYTAACFALTIVVTLRNVHRSSFLTEMCYQSRYHLLFRLTEIILYHLHPSAPQHFSEPVINMLLMALLYLKLLNICCTQFIELHKLSPEYVFLLSRCRSSETASLISLLHSI